MLEATTSSSHVTRVLRLPFNGDEYHGDQQGGSLHGLHFANHLDTEHEERRGRERLSQHLSHEAPLS